MADPVTFDIKAHGSTWMLSRDGERVSDYSHLEQATHDAVRLSRALEETGAPAKVLVHAAGGKVIEIDVAPEITREQERGPDLEPGATL